MTRIIPYEGHEDGSATKVTKISKEKQNIVFFVTFVANSS